MLADAYTLYREQLMMLLLLEQQADVCFNETHAFCPSAS
jgi:hypothetical protein